MIHERRPLKRSDTEPTIDPIRGSLSRVLRSRGRTTSLPTSAPVYIPVIEPATVFEAVEDDMERFDYTPSVFIMVKGSTETRRILRALGKSAMSRVAFEISMKHGICPINIQRSSGWAQIEGVVVDGVHVPTFQAASVRND